MQWINAQKKSVSTDEICMDKFLDRVTAFFTSLLINYAKDWAGLKNSAN